MILSELQGRPVGEGLEIFHNATPECQTHDANTEVILVDSDEGGIGPCYFACKECGKLLLMQRGETADTLQWTAITTQT